MINNYCYYWAKVFIFALTIQVSFDKLRKIKKVLTLKFNSTGSKCAREEDSCMQCMQTDNLAKIKMYLGHLNVSNIFVVANLLGHY